MRNNFSAVSVTLTIYDPLTRYGYTGFEQNPYDAYLGLESLYTSGMTGTFDFTAENESNYNLAVTYLTNNFNDQIGLSVSHFGSSIFKENQLFGKDPDFAGYKISFFRLILNSLLIQPEDGGTRVIADYNWELWGHPIITISSPGNELYQANNIDMIYFTYASTSQVWYTIDNESKVFLTKNSTLILAEPGYHKLKVWANDSTGYITTITIDFKINYPEVPFEFNISLVYAVLGIIAIVLTLSISISLVKVIYSKMDNFTSLTLLATLFMAIIFLSGQLILGTNVVGAGYLDNHTQYEFNISPESDLNINSSLDIQDLKITSGGSIYNNQLVLLSHNQTQNTPDYYILQLDLPADEDLHQINLKSVIKISSTDEIYDIIRDNRQTIVRNSTHFWLLNKYHTSLASLRPQILTIDVHNLSIVENTTTSFENINKFGLSFYQHWKLFFQNDNIWIWDEYNDIQDNKGKVYFLDEFTPTISKLVDKKEFPHLNCDHTQNCYISNVFIDTTSYWIKTDTINQDFWEFWQFDWASQQQSILRLKKSISEPHRPPDCLPQNISESCNDISYTGVLIFNEKMYFTKTDQSGKLLGIQIVQLNSHIRPWPSIEFIYWAVTSAIGIIGTIIIWRKTKNFPFLEQKNK